MGVETINYIQVRVMIQNTNMLNDVADETIRNKCFVSMLPSWSFNTGHKAKQACSLADLSSRGASILIPITQDVSSESFDLVFMSPDDENKVLMILQAEQRWKDEEITDGYIRVGIEFQEVNTIARQAIVSMIKLFIQKRNIGATNSPLKLSRKHMPLRVII